VSRGLADNLRHLRLFVGLQGAGSLTAVAAEAGLSQPAVTQALTALEHRAGGRLFERRAGGRLTDRGRVLLARARRSLDMLDPALVDLAPRLRRTASAAQLRALIATVESGSFTLAARALGLRAPSLQRAVATLEAEAGRRLFIRGPGGLQPSRAAQAVARAARLAFVELAQAEAELAEMDGAAAGPIRVGALPLARAAWLPRALAAFRANRPRHAIAVIEGPYTELLAALSRGEIDLMLGALRDPVPMGDVVQTAVFVDRLALVAAPGHPALASDPPDLAALARADWVVPRSGAPGRAQFEALFAQAGLAPPLGVVESGSALILRELVGEAGYLGCISGAQIAPELQRGYLVPLKIGLDLPARPIGITTRSAWVTTAAQADFLTCLRDAAPDPSDSSGACGATRARRTQA
jgi:LysR family transcriptional regulator, regulator for genes of the gallate degradation pathway